nr:hypothetical protein [candidate division Zixibacteria bacterium]
MRTNFTTYSDGCAFASRIHYELKRAERYRIFLSLAIFNVGPILDLAGNGALASIEDRKSFLNNLNGILKRSIREVDSISNSGRLKIGLLMPETSRQGAEAVVRRVNRTINEFCSDYFQKPADYLVPTEISSFPDAAGARSVASYLDEFMEE